jgi:hypothetical protein
LQRSLASRDRASSDVCPCAPTLSLPSQPGRAPPTAHNSHRHASPISCGYLLHAHATIEDHRHPQLRKTNDVRHSSLMARALSRKHGHMRACVARPPAVALSRPRVGAATRSSLCPREGAPAPAPLARQVRTRLVVLGGG